MPQAAQLQRSSSVKPAERTCTREVKLVFSCLTRLTLRPCGPSRKCPHRCFVLRRRGERRVIVGWGGAGRHHRRSITDARARWGVRGRGLRSGPAWARGVGAGGARVASTRTRGHDPCSRPPECAGARGSCMEHGAAAMEGSRVVLVCVRCVRRSEVKDEKRLVGG